MIRARRALLLGLAGGLAGLATLYGRAPRSASAPPPSPESLHVRDVLSGHLCRCTGYQNIVAAALDAARRMRPGNSPHEG